MKKLAPHDLLGIDQSATEEEIRLAYSSLSKLYHPSKEGGDPLLFKQIHEAYLFMMSRLNENSESPYSGSKTSILSPSEQIIIDEETSLDTEIILTKNTGDAIESQDLSEAKPYYGSGDVKFEQIDERVANPEIYSLDNDIRTNVLSPWLVIPVLLALCYLFFQFFLKDDPNKDPFLRDKNTVQEQSTPAPAPAPATTSESKPRPQSGLDIYSKSWTPPEAVVLTWLQNLGNRDFANAYALMDQEKWSDYDKFKSVDAYGGINKTVVIQLNEQSKTAAGISTVFANYDSYDPQNRNGNFSQLFYLKQTEYGDWVIYKITNTNKAVYF